MRSAKMSLKGNNIDVPETNNMRVPRPYTKFTQQIDIFKTPSLKKDPSIKLHIPDTESHGSGNCFRIKFDSVA